MIYQGANLSRGWYSECDIQNIDCRLAFGFVTISHFLKKHFLTSALDMIDPEKITGVIILHAEKYGRQRLTCLTCQLLS